MNKDLIIYVGYLAGILGAISLVPEVKKALHTHHLADVSWGMLFLFAASAGLWELYGIHIHDYPIIISDGLNFIMAMFLIILKFQYSSFWKNLTLVKRMKRKNGE